MGALTGAQKGATCPQGQLGMSCQVRKAVACRLRKRLIPHVVAREYNVAVLASDRVRFARMITNWAPRPPSGYSFVWVVCAEILACVKSASSTTATDRKDSSPQGFTRERGAPPGLGVYRLVYTRGAGRLGGLQRRYTELRLAVAHPPDPPARTASRYRATS